MVKRKTLLLAGGVAAAGAVGVGIYLATRGAGGSAEVTVIHGTGPVPTLEVLLLDAGSGQPIAGGQVTAGAGFAVLSKATDSTGVAQFTPDPGTNFTITSTAEGYQTLHTQVDFRQDSLRVTVSLKPLISSGTVVVTCTAATWHIFGLLGVTSPLLLNLGQYTSGLTAGQVRVGLFTQTGDPIAGERVALWMDRTDLGGFSFDPNTPGQSVSQPLSQDAGFEMVTGPDGKTPVVYFIPPKVEILQSIFGGIASVFGGQAGKLVTGTVVVSASPARRPALVGKCGVQVAIEF